MSLLKKVLLSCGIIAAAGAPCAAHAAWGIVDSLDLSPFVPMVLDVLMMVATASYEFFVGLHGNGIIYILIWAFLALSLSLYAVKLYLPKKWLGLFGFSGGGEMFAGDVSATQISYNVLKPGLRALIAAIVLLQIRPVYVTEWLVNPFLEFGAIYTRAITDGINNGGTLGGEKIRVECPPDIVEKGWISENSCKFLVQPVSDLTRANNQIIKRGFEFVHNGLRGLVTPIPHGGADFIAIITGILLITTFVGCNLFMALLIIQAIFDFGLALILYPFQVLSWVAKPSDKWFDPWPAFSGIVSALQSLIITMVACAFMLTINVAVIRALFSWQNTTFVASANGFATSNVPQMANTGLSFGEHSLQWMAAILTFYVMLRIFNMTRERIQMYAKGKDSLYKDVTSDIKTTWTGAKKWTPIAGRAGAEIGKGIVDAGHKTVTWIKGKIK